VQLSEISPELADAADVLSDQLRDHLQRMSVFLLPHADTLERRFLAKLERLHLGTKARSALVAITPGAAARILVKGLPPVKFIEQVEYNGRRLAKLNLPPSGILEALQEYDRLLTPIFRELLPAEGANFQWVREQLHFCVILTLNNAYYQVREAETQAFYELFRVELESRNLDELLGRFLQTLVQVCQADAGQLYLLNDDRSSWLLKASAPSGNHLERGPLEIPNQRGRVNLLARAHQVDPSNGTARHLMDPGWKDRYKSCWSVPLATNGRVAGVMQFAFSKTYEWLPREQELLSAAAERCLMAAEKARLMEDLAAREEQIRKLAEHMLHVEEMERRRISRELHDEAGQSLLCIRLQMELLELSLPPECVEWITKLREARDLTERTILEIRRLIAALSPAVLEQLGLGAALRQLINRFRRLHPIRVKLHLGKLGRLPQSTEIILYRLVQECFNNIAKHSGANAVNISVSSADGLVRLNVEDDGVGFQIEEAFARRDSFGLSGMRERVALLGGNFDVQSYPVQGLPAAKKKLRGTRISILLPISRNEERSDSNGKSGSPPMNFALSGADVTQSKPERARRRKGT
jgi:signal transduction histidine kinase